jgi:cell division protein FtsL
MMRLMAFVFFLMASPALAQQQPTPAQTALQIDNVINQWAQTIEAQQKQIADLQKQLEELKVAKPDEKK